jgi:hypothetical protein
MTTEFRYQDGTNVNMLATLPRSGFNWFKLMLNVAYDLSQGGDGDYHYKANSWVTKYQLNPNQVTEEIPDKPYYFHTHGNYEGLEFKNKDKMNIVVLAREIFPTLESTYKTGGYKYSNEKDFMNADDIDRRISFFNSWGARDNYEFIYYNDMVKNPLDAIERACNKWNFDIDSSHLKKSVELCNRKDMLAKVKKEDIYTNQRVSPEANKDGGFFSDDTRNYISDKIRRELFYTFEHKVKGAKK